jgi:hypothetical protein
MLLRAIASFSALLGCRASEYDYEAEPHFSEVEVDCEGQCQKPPHFHCSALLGLYQIKNATTATKIRSNKRPIQRAALL